MNALLVGWWRGGGIVPRGARSDSKKLAARARSASDE